MIRYYLKEIRPEKLEDETWVDAVLDIWLYRYKESKE
jgi:hypothetical protein